MSITQRMWRHFQSMKRPSESSHESTLHQHPKSDPGVAGKHETTVVQEGQIDVRDLIARYDSTKHAELADAYFEPLMSNPIIRRKPFAHAHEAIQIMGDFANVIHGLRLFDRANLLDFGAGTCRSSP